MSIPSEDSPAVPSLPLHRSGAFEHIWDALIVTDLDDRIIDWNPGALRIFGWTREEMLGRRPSVLHQSPDARSVRDSILQEVSEKGHWSGEFGFVRKDGSTGICTSRVVPMCDDEGKRYAALEVSREITAEKVAEGILLQEESLLRTLIDALQDPVFVKDLQGRHIMRNAAGMRLFGRTSKSGSRTVYELPVPREYADLYTKDDLFVFETGTPVVNREEPFLAQDGTEGYLLTSKFPLRDGAGRIVGLVGIGRDITQMRKDAAEREALHAKLRQTQKLESLGVLAGGIAHDFNNLLTSILGNASIAVMDLPPGSPVQDCLEQITEASLRAADLCKQMLAYSGRGRFLVEKLDLGELVEHTAQMLQISISKKVALRFSYEKGLPPVEVDATQIRQVIMNLVINASEAIGDKSGVVSISTGLTRVDRAYLTATLTDADLPDGDYVSLEVSDSGCGMSLETQAKIFDPFFTTKFTGRGLGLAAVLGIVRGHKGAMKVYSEIGRGTSFKVLFPAAAGVADASVTHPGAAPAWQGKGTVLIVDDEETMRSTLARMMHRLGIEPVVVSDGREAVETFRAEPDRFALVLLDLTMPHMDGEQTFAELRRLRSDVRVVLMSGFNAQEALMRFPGKGLAHFLQKPFTIDALRTVLQSLLG